MQRVAIGRALVRRPKAHADGRADRRARRQAARGDARRDEAAAHRARLDHDLCHPRPDRGDGAGRPDRRHARGRAAAGRHAGGGLRPPGQPVRRAVRRQPGDERRRRPSVARRRARRAVRSAARPRASSSRASCCRQLRAARRGRRAVARHPARGRAGRARGRSRAIMPVEAHIIEPLGVATTSSISRSATRILRARTRERLRARSRATRSGRGSIRRRRISSTRDTGDVAAESGWLAWPQIELAGHHQDASAHHTRCEDLDLDDRRRRVLRAAGPDRRGQDHDAAADRRAGKADRGPGPHRRRGRRRLGRGRARRGAGACSNTRSIRATRCARTSSFR